MRFGGLLASSLVRTRCPVPRTVRSSQFTGQDERLEELRDIHHLESKSLTDQIDKLKGQVEEAEKLLKASQSSTSQVEQESAKRKAEIDRLHGELSKATNTAKEEEEKRTKAIALLKTVRQKLVKAEKERDDALKEIGTVKEAEKAEREKERAERAKLQAEIEKVNSERETALQGMRAHFDKELTTMKEKYEKELAALRGQFELEAITTKVRSILCMGACHGLTWHADDSRPGDGEQEGAHLISREHGPYALEGEG